jgi:hypothetical protein
MGSLDGRGDGSALMTAWKEFLNFSEEHAQKSRALSFSRVQKSF